MNISLPLDLNQPASVLQTGGNTLGLNLNQVLDAQVVETQTMLNAFSLNVAGNRLQVQSQQALNLQAGQQVVLQVVKLFPAPEFNLLSPASTSATTQTSFAPLNEPPTLKLVSFQINALSNTVNNSLLSRIGNASATAGFNQADLHMNQILTGRVINTIGPGNNFTLNIAGKTFQVQTEQPMQLSAGQPIQLQVVKVQPQLEFMLIGSALPEKNAPPAALQTEVQNSKSANSPSPILNQLSGNQKLPATVVNIAGGKITLQLATAPNSGAGSAPAKPGNPQVTLDAKQLVLLGSGPATASKNALLNELKIGSQINLQMLQAGKLPVFAVSLSTGLELLSVTKINAFLKQLLPIQNSPVDLINYLSQNLPVLQSNLSVAETLTQLARQILTLIPERAALNEPLKLEDSIRQSGLFLESKLAALLTANGGGNLTDDLKLTLLKFAKALDREMLSGNASQESSNILQNLLQKTNAGLAKITMDQLSALPREDLSKQSWILELPFLQQGAASSLQIEIQQDKQSNSPAGEQTPRKNWAVSISITPPDLATIHCRITCYDGAVNTRFWSQSADIVDKINGHLSYLQQQFEQKGLKTGFMEAHQGKPARQDLLSKSLVNLLSEKV